MEARSSRAIAPTPYRDDHSAGERGIGFKSLTEQIDTTTSGGKLIFHVFAALAEFERDVIRERTQAGLIAARARGRRGGHPKAAALNDAKKVAMAQALYNDKKNSIPDICKTLRVSRSTLYRAASDRWQLRQPLVPPDSDQRTPPLFDQSDRLAKERRGVE